MGGVGGVAARAPGRLPTLLRQNRNAIPTGVRLARAMEWDMVGSGSADQCSGVGYITHGRCHGADVDLPGGRRIERVMPVTEGIEQSLERGTVGPEDLDVGLLRRLQVGGDPDVQDGRAMLRVRVKAERTVSARKSGKLLDAFDDPPDDGQIPIEPAGRLADRDVEAAPVTGVRRVVPGDGQSPIAVDQPGFIGGRIARCGEVTREPYFGSVDIAIRKPHPGE